jgi:hypothetical protein
MVKDNKARYIVFVLLMIALSILLIHVFYMTSWNVLIQMVHSGATYTSPEDFGEMYSRRPIYAQHRRKSLMPQFKRGTNVSMYI